MFQVVGITTCLHSQVNIRCSITTGGRNRSLHKSCTRGIKGGDRTMTNLIPSKVQFRTPWGKMKQSPRIGLFTSGTNPVCNTVTQCFGFQGECKGAVIGILPCISIHTGCGTGGGLGHGLGIVRGAEYRQGHGVFVGTELTNSVDHTRSSLFGCSGYCIVASMDRIGCSTAGAYIDIIDCIGSFHRHKAYEINKIYTEGLNDFSDHGLGDGHSGNGVALCICFGYFCIYRVGFGIASCLGHIIGF